MNTTTESRPATLLRMTAAAILAAAGLAQAGVLAADPVAYTGKAVLCYVDISNMQTLPTEKGKGKTVTTGAVYVWRIISEDNELMNGWEYTYDNFLLNKQERGEVFGHLTFYPDDTYADGYTGWFEEAAYSFKTNKAPSGTYTGVGSLLGVTASYAGAQAEPEPCPNLEQLPPELQHPVLCDDEHLVCQPAGGITLTVTGTLSGYTPPAE